MSTVAGLVLAAGAGHRFGRPKALVELAGERLVDRAVRTLAEGGVTTTYVVQGAAVLDVPGVTVLDSPDWASGMAASLRTGLGALAASGAGAVVVMLVDTPGVTPEVVARLVAAHGAGAEVAVATYGGLPRNPVLMTRAHWGEAAALATGDVGARAFLRAHPELVTSVECGDLADPADVDTPDDLP